MNHTKVTLCNQFMVLLRMRLQEARGEEVTVGGPGRKAVDAMRRLESTTQGTANGMAHISSQYAEEMNRIVRGKEPYYKNQWVRQKYNASLTERGQRAVTQLSNDSEFRNLLNEWLQERIAANEALIAEAETELAVLRGLIISEQQTELGVDLRGLTEKALAELIEVSCANENGGTSCGNIDPAHAKALKALTKAQWGTFGLDDIGAQLVDGQPGFVLEATGAFRLSADVVDRLYAQLA